MYVQVGNSVFIKSLTVKSCNFFGNVVVNFFNCSSAFAYQWVRRSVLFIAFRTSCKVLNVNSCFSAQSFLENKSIKHIWHTLIWRIFWKLVELQYKFNAYWKKIVKSRCWFGYSAEICTLNYNSTNSQKI